MSDWKETRREIPGSASVDAPSPDSPPEVSKARLESQFEGYELVDHARVALTPVILVEQRPESRDPDEGRDR